MATDIPKCLKGRYSSKAITISYIDAVKSLLNQDSCHDYQLMLITPYGIITGDLQELTTKESMEKEIMDQGIASADISIAIEMRNKELNELEAKGKTIDVIDNGASLNLANVTVYKNTLDSPVLKTNSMIVFVDQIVTVSLAPRDLKSARTQS